jgi:LPS sulfotransferase NodH
MNGVTMGLIMIEMAGLGFGAGIVYERERTSDWLKSCTHELVKSNEELQKTKEQIKMEAEINAEKTEQTVERGKNLLEIRAILQKFVDQHEDDDEDDTQDGTGTDLDRK